MASLTGQKIKDTYDGLLKLINSTLGLPTSGKVLVQDGLGNDSALQLGRANNGATITGQLVLNKNVDSGSHIELQGSDNAGFVVSRDNHISIGGTEGYSASNINVKKTNGYVGIKQRTPLAPLHVKRNGEAIRLESTGDNQCSIDFRQGSTKRGHIEFNNATDTIEIKTTKPTGSQSKIKFSVSGIPGADATEAMRIQNSANGDKQVLIGGANQSVPNNQNGLWVFGDIQVSGQGIFSEDLRVGGTKSIFNSDLSVNGRIDVDSFKLKGLNDAPTNSTDTGVVGQIKYTANYIYVCVQNNVWKRVALQSF